MLVCCDEVDVGGVNCGILGGNCCCVCGYELIGGVKLRFGYGIGVIGCDCVGLNVC